MSTPRILDADMATLARWGRTGFDWWVEELRAMIPLRLQRSLNPGPAVVARIEGDRLALFRRGRQVERGRGAMTAAMALAPNQVLVREVRLPALGSADLRRLITLEADRLMPFPAGSALIDFDAGPRGTDGQQLVVIAALPLARAEAVFAAARAADLAVGRIGVANAGGFRHTSIRVAGRRATRRAADADARRIADLEGFRFRTGTRPPVRGSGTKRRTNHRRANHSGREGTQTRIALAPPSRRSVAETASGDSRYRVLASDKITTTDAATEYETLGARIGELRKHQLRLDTLLHSGRNLRGSDILYVQDRLFRSGVDEAGLAQSRRDLERRAQVAQVSVTLFEPLPVAKPLPPIQAVQASWAHGYANAVRRAEFHRSVLTGRLVAAFAFAVVYAPLWFPVIGTVAFLLWYHRAALVRVIRVFGAFAAHLPKLHLLPSPKRDAVETGN